MLNPYVPGGSHKKQQVPFDPLNDIVDNYNRAGPVDQPMPKPQVFHSGAKPPLPVLQPGPVSSPPPFAGIPIQPMQPAALPTVRAGGTLSGFDTTERATNAMPALPQFQFAEDRLTNMLAEDSPFLREAQRRGLDAATSRGALNSSLAAGLSTREAIRAAAPIATADAQFTQEDYLTGRRGLIDDALRGNESIRTRNRDNLLASLEDTRSANDSTRTMQRDTLLGDIRSREMNQEADLMGQRDMRLSTLRRQENQFDATLTEQARENDTQRQAWLSQQTALTSAYTTAISDARRSGLGFLDQLGTAFINDPEVYSPEVVSGMSNFFRGLVDGTTNSSIRQIVGDIIGLNTPPATRLPGEATQPVAPPRI